MPELIPSREVFRHFPFWAQFLFYLTAFAGTIIFFYGFYSRIRKYRQGRADNRFDHLTRRFLNALSIVLRNQTLYRGDAYAGFAHSLILWGFIVLFIGTVIVFLDHDILRLMGMHLLQGTFYLWFSLILDVFGLLFLVGLFLMWARRTLIMPYKLDYARVDRDEDEYDRSGYLADDGFFLGLLFFIGATGFLIEGFRIYADQPPWAGWSPVGWLTAQFLSLMRLSPATVNFWHAAAWWTHAVAVMIFLAYVPFSKAMHMVTDFVNLMFRDNRVPRRLPGVSETQLKEGMGYKTITDFTWKELLDLDACTKCGRCHEACPARSAGQPLSPRDLILDLRTFADATFGTGEWFSQRVKGWNTDRAVIPGGIIKAETLWSCTTCMACMESCPVGIEHLLYIVQMRRTLVDEATMDDSLQEALMNIGDYGNSFGQPARARGKWSQELDFPIKDARREAVEYLWFVGDYASFDPRIQENSRRVARIFHRLGIDFGILYEGEKNAGNDVRRVGEEGLYEMLVEDNMAVLQQAKFQKIVTTDPHSYNTLKNEYSEFGLQTPVYHYTQLLARLIDEGRLRFQKKLNYQVTYHDPCYLGRYNRETEAPRKILRALGVEVKEMPRCGTNTFCCGAGGGRIWMDDAHIKERPSEQRIKEALTLGKLDYFVVACPKDFAMYSDAVKTSGNEGSIKVCDIIQLVEEALG